jgi:hypothetical protein
VRKDQRDQYSRPVSSERVDPMDGLT